MAEIRLRGVTWNHRRAIDPLHGTAAMFAKRRPDVEIVWDSQPLSGLEFTSVEALARKYDLIVFDHAFCGAIAASQCLVPLDGVVADYLDRFAGPTLSSYRFADRTWGIPIDAATQVQVVRPDLLAGLEADPPRRWSEMMALGRKARGHGLWLAIGLKGVHSLMTFYSLTANLGSPCATGPGPEFCEPYMARIALTLMRELLGYCPPGVLDWNSIRLHDEMVARDDLVACPAVQGYAAYAESDQRRPLRLLNFPGPSGTQGAALGGTGLGVSAHSANMEAALDFARFAAEAETQRAFARHHGQPARFEAWQDTEIDAAFGGAFSRTRSTLEQAWVRPRYDGYLKFQEEAGDLIEAHLRGAGPANVLIDRLRRMHRDYSEP
jgi:multiple sugar transport system substrate-binding protein